jgi:hypothetical protein
LYTRLRCGRKEDVGFVGSRPTLLDWLRAELGERDSTCPLHRPLPVIDSLT